MPFLVVNGVSRRKCVLDGAVIVEGEGGSFEVNLGRPTLTNGYIVTYCARERHALPK